jgi:NYN domain
MKSALFVDFDNVYSGLKRLDGAFAETFAAEPMRWLDWITGQLQIPLEPAASVKRRILVRRCYLNPVMYQRYRFGFSKAGFEIIDCPPMTTAGKTSTDIHMVLDMVDVLQSDTRYDEFIVFSADADFTPVLRKLRRNDRRTTIFAAGATSAAYDASSDLIIDPDAFISQALGFGGEAAANDLAALAQSLGTQPFSLGTATAQLRDLCAARKTPVGRADIYALIRALLFNGFEPNQGPQSFDDIVAATCGVAVAACAREGLTISDSDRAALLDWVTTTRRPNASR